GVVGRAVEQAHYALDDENVGAVGSARSKRADGLATAQPRVEVAAGPPRREGVIAGVDEVGPDLGGGNTHAAARERGHQPGGDGGLADAGVRARDDEAGPEARHATMIARHAVGSAQDDVTVPV